MAAGAGGHAATSTFALTANREWFDGRWLVRIDFHVASVLARGEVPSRLIGIAVIAPKRPCRRWLQGQYVERSFGHCLFVVHRRPRNY